MKISNLQQKRTTVRKETPKCQTYRKSQSVKVNQGEKRKVNKKLTIRTKQDLKNTRNTSENNGMTKVN
jgi:hypothetical protein